MLSKHVHRSGIQCSVQLALHPHASDTVLGSFHAWRPENEGQQSTICLYLIITRMAWAWKRCAVQMRA